MNILTVKECAERLKISPACVYQLVSERKIAHARIGCGRGAIRITEQDLQAFLAGCKVERHSLTGSGTGFKHIRLGG
jgi:excisionase family DNA binding protein